MTKNQEDTQPVILSVDGIHPIRRALRSATTKLLAHHSAVANREPINMAEFRKALMELRLMSQWVSALINYEHDVMRYMAAERENARFRYAMRCIYEHDKGGDRRFQKRHDLPLPPSTQDIAFVALGGDDATERLNLEGTDDDG